MSCEKFNVASVRQHRDGIHMPRVTFEAPRQKGEYGVLTMMGRSIPVISAEQLAGRLKLIGCREEVIDEIVGSLFGFAVAAETTVAASELSECLV